MTHGLRVWDAAGQVTLDVTDRTMRFVGVYSGTVASSGTQTVTVPNWANNSAWDVVGLNGWVSYTKTANGFTVSDVLFQGARNWQAIVLRK